MLLPVVTLMVALVAAAASASIADTPYNEVHKK
jgi:hypothetical protein